MKLPAHHEAALLRALHSTEGAATRWGATVRPDDETLRRCIAEEFGVQGGFYFGDMSAEYKGGANPRITIQIGNETPTNLSGRELLFAVREAMNLPRPDELF